VVWGYSWFPAEATCCGGALQIAARALASSFPMPAIAQALVAALSVALTAFSGAAFLSRRLADWIAPRLSLLVALAAGVLAAVTWHVLEEAGEAIGVLPAALVAALAAAAAMLSHRLVPEAHCHEDDEAHHAHGHAHVRSARSVILGDGLHSLADGLALGAVFAFSPAAGVAAAAGIFLHEAVRQSSQFFIFRAAGYSPARAIRTSVTLALLVVPGAALGVFLSGYADWVAPALAALAAGAFAEILIGDLAPAIVGAARRSGAWRHALAVALGVAAALLASSLGEGH
jgi:zinc and cadmium transporter